VVVGWDFSENAGQLLSWAADHARGIGARLVLVHVVELQPWLEVPIPPLPDNERARMAAEMQQAAAGVGMEAEVVVPLANSASSALLEVAAARGASLICVGRNRTGLSRLLLGSVASQVVRHSPVPVLVVPALAREAA
jgi:nucleotide-binding universal stress UspA family protein